MVGEKTHTHTHTHIYIYIYEVFFNPVNPELGKIQTGQLKYSNLEYLNIPPKELNINKIHGANNIISRKNPIFGHIWIINLFPSC